MRLVTTTLAVFLFLVSAVAKEKPKGALTPTHCGQNTVATAGAPTMICLHAVYGEDKALLSLASGREVDFFRVLDLEKNNKNIQFWTLGEVKVQYEDGHLFYTDNDFMETTEVIVQKTSKGYNLTSDDFQLNVKLTPVAAAL